MKNRRVIVVVGCLLLASAAALLWPREREPIYNGRSLSEWISRCPVVTFLGDGSSYVTAQPVFGEAAAAVRHIGTNALPCLLKWIRYHPPIWKRRAHALLGRLPDQFIPAFIGGGYDLPARTAVEGFSILGPEAAQAIPELLRIVADPRTDRSVLENVKTALAGIGEPARVPMLAFAADVSNANRIYVFEALEMIRDAEAAKGGK